jgi:hypothetical protein
MAEFLAFSFDLTEQAPVVSRRLARRESPGDPAA